MVKLLLSLFISLLIAFQLNAQNCPDYANTVSSTGEACGEQNYTMTIENTSCNGEIFMTITTNFEDGLGFIWELTSILTGNDIASGSDGNTTIAIGPLNANVVGTTFSLRVIESYGIGFDLLPGEYVKASQGANDIANVTTVTSSSIFDAGFNISSATLTVTTPSGLVTRTVNYCRDFIVQIPLANNNFCNPLNINLPWEITCDVSGAVLSSGTHSVIVSPQVPSDASDLVDITWNATTCSWDISPQNDCELIDINTIFTVSPDPTGVADACSVGDVDFIIDYLGISGAPSCCETAGSLVPIEYSATMTSSDAVPSSSPYYTESNHAGYINIPPNNSGGSAAELSLCVEIDNYCRTPFPYPSNDPNNWAIAIRIDGIEVELKTFPASPSGTVCIDLTDYPNYNQSSVIDIYVTPTLLSDGSHKNVFTPGKQCNNLFPGEWKANISATLNAKFEEMIGSPVSCSFTLTKPRTCCDPVPPTASNPAPITVACAADVPAPNPAVVTDEASMCATDPTVTFVSDVSDGNVCQGEQITRTYHVEDDCGNGIDVTQLITISATNPTFALNGIAPTTCVNPDGEIEISGLNSNTAYSLTYTQNGTVVGPTTITTDAAGEYSITGLDAGSYTDFNIALNSCSTCEGQNAAGIILNALTAPTVDAGLDVQICEDESVTLTATNPDGANISWSNGVTDGVAFTPTTTTTYTVTAELLGCISTDQVVVTVMPKPTIDAGANQDLCINSNDVTLTAHNPDGATISWDNGVVDGVTFSQGLGTTTYTVTAESTENCISTDVVNITVHPLPTPTINAIADQCLTTTSVPLSGSPSGGTFSGNGVPGSIFNPSVAGAGNHTITYSYTDGNNCSNTDITTVDVISGPTFTVSKTDPSSCVIADGTITISDLDLNTVYAVTFERNGTTVGPTNYTSNGAGNIIINNLAAGSYTSFSISVSGGCPSIDNTILNLVNPNPPTVNAGSDIQICEGEDVTLTASNLDGANISWDNGITDGNAFTPTATTTYTVTAELLGCTSTDQVIVTVIPNPTVDAGNDIIVCENMSVTLSGTGATTYVWDNGVVNGQPFTPPAGTTVYTVTGTNSAGCEAVDQVTVTVSTSLDVSFTANVIEGCAPLTVNFTNTSSGAGNCVYTLSDGTTFNSCNPTHTFSQPGCYDVTLMIEDNQGCFGSHTETSMICVESTPIASFTANPGIIGGLTSEVNFNNSSIGADHYQWKFGDGQTSDEMHPSHQYNLEEEKEESYIITLIATSTLGCVDSISAIINVEEELIYYVPNTFTPNEDNINETFKPIFTSGFEPSSYHLTIFNRWGEIVFESYDVNYGWDGRYGVEHQFIAKEGVYLYTIEFKSSNNDKRMTVSGHLNLLH